jgi:hypothetical protein
MRPGWTVLPVLLVCTAGAAHAAPTTTLKVRPDGTLAVPAATMKALKVKRDKTGMVCVEFPRAPDKGPPGLSKGSFRPKTSLSELRAPKLFAGVRRDGSLRIYRSRLPTAAGPAPGKPGTVYLATGKAGCLVLMLPKR